MCIFLSHWDKIFRIGRNMSDKGKNVFLHLIRVKLYCSRPNTSLALIHDMVSENLFSKNIPTPIIIIIINIIIFHMPSWWALYIFCSLCSFSYHEGIYLADLAGKWGCLRVLRIDSTICRQDWPTYVPKKTKIAWPPKKLQIMGISIIVRKRVFLYHVIY